MRTMRMRKFVPPALLARIRAERREERREAREQEQRNARLAFIGIPCSRRWERIENRDDV